MATFKQNVEIFAGDAADLAFTVLNAAGVAVNLTAAAILMKISRHDSLPALVTKAGVLDADPTTGKFTVSLTATETAGLDGVYVHQIKSTQGGKDTVVASGYLTANRRL